MTESRSRAGCGWIWSVLIGMGAIVAFATPTGAQLIEDTAPGRSLGTTVQRSVLPGVDVVRGGTRPQNGQNLFHSFQEFNVPDRGGVYFANPAGVQNILSRVTGSNRSNILGTIGVLGPANLFLINPNGIVFGPNSSLDVQGSFFATTANAVQLGNGGLFNASQPASSNLLNVNPSAFLFNAIATQNQPEIVVRSQAANTILGDLTNGLQVPNGQTLLLLGGSVVVEGGQLNAWGGRVEIGAVEGLGALGLNENGSLQFQDSIQRANVALTAGARVDVSLNDGGEIGVTAGDIRLVEGSGLLAGIAINGTVMSRAGDVRLDATGTIVVEDASQISNDVAVNTIGTGGNVQIAARGLQVTGGSQLTAATLGTGNAGNVMIVARDKVLIDGTGEGLSTINGVVRPARRSSAILSRVERGATGDGGTISITTGSFSLINGAQISSGTFEKGNAGNVRVNARDTISLSGSGLVDDADGFRTTVSSAMFSSVAIGSEGKGGDLYFSTGSLTLFNGAQLVSVTQGIGSAGNVIIIARDRVLIQGNNNNGQLASAVFSGVTETGTGKGGNVEITSGSLDVRDGAELVSSTFGKGDAGNVAINARDLVLFQNQGFVSSRVAATGAGQGGDVEITSGSLEVRDGAQLIASTDGWGNAGNVVINVRDRVLFQGRSTDGKFGSGAFSDVGEAGKGQGGDVEITSGSLEMRDSAQLLTSTLGAGNAGNVVIDVQDRVLFQGTSKDGRFPSAAITRVEETGIGQGGNVEIIAGSLEVRDGAQLITNTFGTGNAGNVGINVRDRVLLDGTTPISGRSSGIFTNNTPNATIGTGSTGNVWLTATHFTLSNGAVINARTANDQPGGDITLNVAQLNLLSGGQILSTSNGSGPAGTITLTATDQVRISGTDPTYATRFVQFGTAVAPLSANSGLYVRSASSGPAGNILLTTPRLTLDHQGRIDAQSATVSGGNLFLTVPSLLLLRNGGQISATAGTANPQTLGDGGNININARFIVAIPKENSDITANATQGRGGNVTITTQGIFGLQFRPQLTPLSDITASSDFGVNGIVNLNTPDNSNLQNSLNQLPQTLIDTGALLANSCIVRRNQPTGSFFITGSGGLPERPGTAASPAFPTGEVQNVKEPEVGNQKPEVSTQNLALSTQNSSARRPWKIGDPIVEPQGVYQLPDGQLVLSHECQK